MAMAPDIVATLSLSPRTSARNALTSTAAAVRIDETCRMRSGDAGADAPTSPPGSRTLPSGLAQLIEPQSCALPCVSLREEQGAVSNASSG